MPRYPGGIIRKTPVTPAGPFQNGAASGVWTLAEATYWQKQGLWPIAGNFLAVEDVFSTYLYTGNGSTQTITNGLNVSGQGGLVWVKQRNVANSHILTDSARGVANTLYTNTTGAQNSLETNTIGSFNSDGFTLNNSPRANVNGSSYASWTFRKAPKFFDTLTYTGTGANRTIAHNLGVAPGCIIVKRTDTTADWQVYHRSNANTEYMVLNTTAAKATGTTRWNSTTPTATEFTVGTDTNVNASGGTYVAYLFAHDATADGIIQCGSYTGNGSATGPTVTLGWEPQWLLVKDATTAGGSWIMFDNMRGMPVGSNDQLLYANLNNSEASLEMISPTSTGFSLNTNSVTLNGSGDTYIYIAIRRGPMKTPTVGTSVFMPVARTGTGANATVTSGFVTDTVIEGNRASSTPGTKFGVWDRLRYANFLITTLADAEVAGTSSYIQTNPWDLMTGYKVGTTSTLTNASSNTFVDWMFRRAPGFFDVVTYTGNGVAGRAVNHNLGVVPELMIVKRRNLTDNWQVYSANILNTQYLVLNSQAGPATGTTRWNSTTPSATTFTVGTDATVNSSGGTYVAYLFASCPGVSKVGTYIGTGESDGSPAAPQTINCGFSSGARFVLIKDMDGSDGWFVFDTARGITTTESPWLTLNSTNAESSGTGNQNYVEPNSSGFYLPLYQNIINPCNYLGRKYIYLAIA